MITPSESRQLDSPKRVRKVIESKYPEVLLLTYWFDCLNFSKIKCQRPRGLLFLSTQSQGLYNLVGKLIMAMQKVSAFGRVGQLSGKEIEPRYHYSDTK